MTKIYCDVCGGPVTKFESRIRHVFVTPTLLQDRGHNEQPIGEQPYFTYRFPADLCDSCRSKHEDGVARLVAFAREVFRGACEK